MQKSIKNLSLTLTIFFVMLIFVFGLEILAKMNIRMVDEAVTEYKETDTLLIVVNDPWILHIEMVGNLIMI